MGMIWESERAKANRLDFHRRNTAYRLTNMDPDSADYGASIVHTAVTAKRECGMDYETFYGMAEDGLDIMVKVENLGSAMKTPALLIDRLNPLGGRMRRKGNGWEVIGNNQVAWVNNLAGVEDTVRDFEREVETL